MVWEEYLADGGGLKSPNEAYSWTDGGVDATYVYGRAADGRGVPRFLVMDDWERGEPFAWGGADERG